MFSYLKDKEPGELIKKHPTDKEYRTKTHDSLVISNGKWNWTTRGIGGRTALDYLIKVRDMPFVEAVRTLCGDLKATQGDTGHSQINMITDVYAHILDEDRKVNAQKFETAFYAKHDLRKVSPPKEENDELNGLITALQQSPELVQMLSALLSKQAISN